MFRWLKSGREPLSHIDRESVWNQNSRSTSKRRIARAFSQQLVFRGIGMIATIGVVTATTRYLGPSEYGALTTAVVFVGLWTSLTELGIGSVVVRRVMSDGDSLERLVRVNLGVSVVYSMPLFVIAVTCGVAIYRDNSDVTILIAIVAVSLILTTLSSCFLPVFTATLRFTAVAVSDLISKLASLALTVILVSNHASLVWFAVVQLGPPIVVLIIQGLAASRIVNCRPIFSWAESRFLLTASMSQTMILAIGFLYFRIDGVILSVVSSQDEVGIYGIAYALAYSVSVIPIFFSSSTLSAMTHLFANSLDRFAAFTARCTEIMLFLGAPIAVVGGLLAPQIVEAVGSSDFVDRGGVALALLIVAAAISFLAGIVSQALFAAHDQSALLKLDASILVCNILLNVILAPRFGVIAAGATMVATECLKLIVTTRRLQKITRYRIPVWFALRLVPSVVAAAIVATLMADVSILITIPATVLVYLFANFVLGPLTFGELKKLGGEREPPDG